MQQPALCQHGTSSSGILLGSRTASYRGCLQQGPGIESSQPAAPMCNPEQQPWPVGEEGLFQGLSPCHTARASECPHAGSVWHRSAALLHTRTTAAGSSTKPKPCPGKRPRQDSAVQRQTQRGKAAALRSQLLQLRPTARVWGTPPGSVTAAARGRAPPSPDQRWGSRSSANPSGERTALLGFPAAPARSRAPLGTRREAREDSAPSSRDAEGRTRLRLQLWERRIPSNGSSSGPKLRPHRGSAGSHGREIREDPQGSPEHPASARSSADRPALRPSAPRGEARRGPAPLPPVPPGPGPNRPPCPSVPRLPPGALTGGPGRGGAGRRLPVPLTIALQTLPDCGTRSPRPRSLARHAGRSQWRRGVPSASRGTGPEGQSARPSRGCVTARDGAAGGRCPAPAVPGWRHLPAAGRRWAGGGAGGGGDCRERPCGKPAEFRAAL